MSTVLRIPFNIKYCTEKPVPIAEVVSSLESLEKLLLRTPAFIEAAYPIVQISETRILIEKIETGSLIEDFIVEYVVGGGDNYDELKRVLHKITKESPVMKNLVVFAAGALITYGVMQVVKPNNSTSINAHNSVVFANAGDVNLSDAQLNQLFKNIKDKKQLAKQSIDIVRPAKEDANGSIEFAQLPQLNLSTSFVDEVPGDYSPEPPQTKVVPYEGVVVMISASDKDKSQSGWAGVVPDVASQRKRIVLGEDINPESLHGRTKVLANINLHQRYNKKSKAYSVEYIELLSFELISSNAK